jgi:hypothetical protein
VVDVVEVDVPVASVVLVVVLVDVEVDVLVEVEVLVLVEVDDVVELDGGTAGFVVQEADNGARFRGVASNDTAAASTRQTAPAAERGQPNRAGRRLPLAPRPMLPPFADEMVRRDDRRR